MIIGIGFDLVDIERIKNLILDKEYEFLSNLLTAKELEQFQQYKTIQRKAEWVAGRFAAKESLFKALGTGFGGSPNMLDVEILADPFGKPILLVSPLIKNLLNQQAIFHLSITHTKTTAGAVVIIEQIEGREGVNDAVGPI